jgi:hypothetical protein
LDDGCKGDGRVTMNFINKIKAINYRDAWLIILTAAVALNLIIGGRPKMESTIPERVEWSVETPTEFEFPQNREQESIYTIVLIVDNMTDRNESFGAYYQVYNEDDTLDSGGYLFEELISASQTGVYTMVLDEDDAYMEVFANSSVEENYLLRMTVIRIK